MAHWANFRQFDANKYWLSMETFKFHPLSSLPDENNHQSFSIYATSCIMQKFYFVYCDCKYTNFFHIPIEKFVTLRVAKSVGKIDRKN